MATDAKFDKVMKIIPHDNADSLEIAIVSNFPCVVRKGEFKEGDWVFYIRDDAKLLGWDEYKVRQERDKEAAKTGAFVTQDVFTCTWQWQDSLLKYLGGGGRVKSIKLRGRVSMGILLKPDVVCPIATIVDGGLFDESAAKYNASINDPDTGAAFLEKKFGISHWSAPTIGFGAMNVKYAGLPMGQNKTDQENWENLPESDLHLGATALITKKLDGCSCTITCYPNGTYDISSRSQTFNVEAMATDGTENVWTKYTKEAVKAGCWYAKVHGQTLTIRGEVCCRSVQNSSYNKDCQREDFFVFATEFPNEMKWHRRHGTYGWKWHFTEVIKEMNNNGFNVKTVPVLGEEIVTKELLQKYNDMPWEWGEGIVLNVKANGSDMFDSFVWSYKSKSREYLMKMK